MLIASRDQQVCIGQIVMDYQAINLMLYDITFYA